MRREGENDYFRQMKKFLYLLSFSLVMSCAQPAASVHNGSSADSATTVSADSLSFSCNGLRLNAIADNDSITLRYQLSSDIAWQQMEFRYPFYTGIAFPAEGVAILRNNGYTTAAAGLIGDSLLLLPVINHVPDGLSLYVINLRSRQISFRQAGMLT